MAVSYRSSSHVGYFNTNNVTLTKPTGTATGDVMIAVLHVENGTVFTITKPSGWSNPIAVDTGTQLVCYVLWKIAAAGEATNHAFSGWTSTNNWGSIHSFQGQAGNSGTDNPFGSDSNVGQFAAQSTTLTSVSYTAAGAGLGVWIHDGFYDSASVTKPAAFTQVHSQADGSAVVATRTDAAGSLTTGTGTGPGGGPWALLAFTILDSITVPDFGWGDWLLEDGSGSWQLEDGSGLWLLDTTEAAPGTNHTHTPTDDLGLTDSPLFVQSHAHVKVDPIGLADAAVVSLADVQLVTDNMGVTDSAQVGLVLTQSGGLGCERVVDARLSP
jgi:hypothetical protein